MRIPHKQKFFLPILIIIVVLVVDQITKAWVMGSQIPNACNTGFAFGFGSGVLVGLIAFLVLMVVVGLFTDSAELTAEASEVGRGLRFWGLVLIIGGGVSNIIDRLIRGCVVDFIKLPSLTRWPTFNLADAAITVGLVILIISLVRNLKNPRVRA